jgi:Transglycosylase SLT domain/D-alanyl-D-alanine carboxypeptidase
MSTAKTVGAASTVILGLLVLTAGLPLIAMFGLTASGEPGEPTAGFVADGIPPVAADAYERAAAAARDFTPACEIPAWLLAGVGQVESGHGTHGGATISPDGTVTPPIVGVALPRLGADTDGGTWDGSSTADHAVGPTQFIPATWRAYGRDGNGDGTADPHNMYDATLTAAVYLCSAGSPMATEANWRRGLLAYNHSQQYVTDVLAAGARYRVGIATGPRNGSLRLVHVDGIGLTNESWAPQIRAMISAAADEGVILTGRSYREPADQIALRRAHCGTSNYAIYEMPANDCRPPTARPGTSLHEVGLAIDFNNCTTRVSACHRWLASHAHIYNLHPLPSEPWHWSANGQ